MHYLGPCMLNLARDNGKREMEGRARTQFAFAPDAPAVRLHDVLHDRQPQTRPAGVTRARLVDPVETLKDAVEMLESDALAEVLHHELNLVIECLGVDADAPS